MGRVLTLDEALAERERRRAAGETVVLTNGHFELLHVGHLDYLERARALGDWLVVGVNGDTSTRRLKGPGRPLVPARERARLLAALEPVDAVVIFDEVTAERLVTTLRPDLYVKGGDYGPGGKPLPEAPAVRAYGGQVLFLPYLSGHSTTALLQRILAAMGAAAGPTGSSPSPEHPEGGGDE